MRIIDWSSDVCSSDLIADACNVALPTLNEREGDVVELLRQTGRLSNDVADLLAANRPFVDAAFNQGSDTLALLFEQREQVIPTVVGLRAYLQSLSSIIRIDMGDELGRASCRERVCQYV